MTTGTEKSKFRLKLRQVGHTLESFKHLSLKEKIETLGIRPIPFSSDESDYRTHSQEPLIMSVRNEAIPKLEVKRKAEEDSSSMTRVEVPKVVNFGLGTQYKFV